MTEKQPKFFHRIENNRVNHLGDEFRLAFTPDPDLPQIRVSSN